MENQFIVTWQYDNEGDAGLVKVMSCDTREDAVSFLEKSANAGNIRDRQSEGYPYSDKPIEYWVKPGFSGRLAYSVV